MTDQTTRSEDNDPTNTGSSSTAPLETGPDATGAGKTDPNHGEGPKDAEDLDLTPQGLSDEPAKQEDPESLAKPDNS